MFSTPKHLFQLPFQPREAFLILCFVLVLSDSCFWIEKLGEGIFKLLLDLVFNSLPSNNLQISLP